MNGGVVEVRGLPELHRALKRLERVTSARANGPVLEEAGRPIVDAARRRARKRTGALAQSIEVFPADVRGARAEVLVGTTIPYGPRIEFGFAGVDALGRVYSEPGYPFLRPAFDERSRQAQKIIADRIRTAVMRVR